MVSLPTEPLVWTLLIKTPISTDAKIPIGVNIIVRCAKTCGVSITDIEAAVFLSHRDIYKDLRLLTKINDNILMPYSSASKVCEELSFVGIKAYPIYFMEKENV